MWKDNKYGMAYIVNKTDGTILTTIVDGTIDNTSSLTLFGKSYSGFGELLNEDLVRLLENSASTASPAAPLRGEIWFDTATNQLNTLPSLVATLRRTKLSDVVIPVVGESKVISSQWSAKLAFCFIDGGHGDEPTRSDYINWVPKIAVNGLLAIHDVFADPKDGGQAPYKFIYNAALDSGEFVEVSATGSLRILKRTKISG